jgi:hypothetical protein
MEIVIGLIVVMGFMIVLAIAIGACGERYEKRERE